MSDDEDASGGDAGDGEVEQAVEDVAAEPDRETVEIEVPPNLLRAWEHRAEQAKLSLSEYVVRMTESGRMSVQMQPETVGEGTTMTVEQLTDDVVELLRREGTLSWEGVVDAVASNLEENVEEALDRLQEDDVVRYSGLEGGYRLVEDDR